ncbi:TlpA disulfide reductase family protein [uncultured Polaribacter sp.]|uniref:TlpA family protein disulfide reductase n=1 Tax=uncultured Polaribacter sp. TaxID=174711 RepID=UPI00261AB625|nr:TlpA disulfide reductase family protein [uncultured Polaribacter sp.]
MKKLSLLLFTIVLMSACTKEHSKEYITFQGKLENNKDSVLTVASRTGIIKTIQINEDGTFKDTLKVAKGDIYTFQTSNAKRAPIYLKNGFDLQLTGDAEDFMTSFKYSGEGAENSNFMIAQIKESQHLGNPSLLLDLEEEAFKNKLEAIKKRYDSILNSYQDIDSSLVSMANQQTTQMMNYFTQTYASNKGMAKGTPSPKFENYVDFKGGKKSLDAFKGKYVYIDVWATWCGPCIQQIPYLKELEKEYHTKNIEFISLSTDESRRSGGSWEAAEKKWRDFVKAKQLTGTQLWAGQDFSFQQAYQINSIPRFILIDPQGNIVNANAPRPSDPELKEVFTSLGI